MMTTQSRHWKYRQTKSDRTKKRTSDSRKHRRCRRDGSRERIPLRKGPVITTETPTPTVMKTTTTTTTTNTTTTPTSPSNPSPRVGSKAGIRYPETPSITTNAPERAHGLCRRRRSQPLSTIGGKAGRAPPARKESLHRLRRERTRNADGSFRQKKKRDARNETLPRPRHHRSMGRPVSRNSIRMRREKSSPKSNIPSEMSIRQSSMTRPPRPSTSLWNETHLPFRRIGSSWSILRPVARTTSIGKRTKVLGRVRASTIPRPLPPMRRNTKGSKTTSEETTISSTAPSPRKLGSCNPKMVSPRKQWRWRRASRTVV